MSNKLAEEVALHHARRSDPQAYVVTPRIEKVRCARRGMCTGTSSSRRASTGGTLHGGGIRVEQPGRSHAVASCYFTMCTRGEADEARSVAVERSNTGRRFEARRRTGVRRQEAYRRRQGSPRSPTRRRVRAARAAPRAQSSRVFGPAGGRPSMSWERCYPELENVPSKVFALPSCAAYELRRSRRRDRADRPVIVRVNRINFLQPCGSGQAQAGEPGGVHRRTSVTVEVTIERISWDR